MTSRARILIVDDERFNLNLLVDLLGSDYDTMVAKNGAQALKRAHSATPPDIILLDIMMPDMDGYEVCRQLMQDPRSQHIPVIFISALSQSGDEAKGLELGAVDYVSKPISPALVKLRVRNHLRLKQQNDLLRDLATLDGLTGIPNRRRFEQDLKRQWRKCAALDEPLSLVMVDIDYFKAYNDHYGHVSGDECLKKIAQALHAAVQREADLVARFGGEEFACLLPGTDAPGAATMAGRLQEAVRQLALPHAQSEVADQISLSLGAATCIPDAQAAPSGLLEEADKQLYLAKQAGRNRFCAATDDY